MISYPYFEGIHKKGGKNTSKSEDDTVSRSNKQDPEGLTSRRLLRLPRTRPPGELASEDKKKAHAREGVTTLSIYFRFRFPFLLSHSDFLFLRLQLPECDDLLHICVHL